MTNTKLETVSAQIDSRFRKMVCDYDAGYPSDARIHRDALAAAIDAYRAEANSEIKHLSNFTCSNGAAYNALSEEVAGLKQALKDKETHVEGQRKDLDICQSANRDALGLREALRAMTENRDELGRSNLELNRRILELRLASGLTEKDAFLIVDLHRIIDVVTGERDALQARVNISDNQFEAETDIALTVSGTLKGQVKKLSHELRLMTHQRDEWKRDAAECDNRTEKAIEDRDAYKLQRDGAEIALGKIAKLAAHPDVVDPAPELAIIASLREHIRSMAKHIVDSKTGVYMDTEDGGKVLAFMSRKDDSDVVDASFPFTDADPAPEFAEVGEPTWEGSKCSVTLKPGPSTIEDREQAVDAAMKATEVFGLSNTAKRILLEGVYNAGLLKYERE